MDHAAIEARREEILPGDLLQGIFRLPIASIHLTRPAGHYPIISVPVTLLASSNARPVIDPPAYPLRAFCIARQRTRKPRPLPPNKRDETSSHVVHSILENSSFDPLSGATPFRATLKQERLGDDRCLQVPLTHLSRIRV